MKLVVVESPAKAKTIEKYLGEGYRVVASMGHVRALPSKPGSVLPESNFDMRYELTKQAPKAIAQIAKLAAKADEVLLATDPDREGEAIAWHVAEILRSESALKQSCKVSRAAFYELTMGAILKSMASPRSIDMNLVRAQQSRQALDYLVGFTLSPVLWRKLPSCRSAGRVQSVALRMICERESEILSFKSQEYWSIHLNLFRRPEETITAKLVRHEGLIVEKLSICNQDDALKIKSNLEGKQFSVAQISKKFKKRNPPAPFNTSSLQQEASRKLGFNVKKTMQIAQKLYEGVLVEGENMGLITYMRTDGVTVSEQALGEIRSAIVSNLGSDYLSAKPNQYKTKTKNAQEAHEAIRPTHFNLAPSLLSKYLQKDQLDLYNLIWKRTLGSQMKSAVFELVSTDLVSDDGLSVARSNYSLLSSKFCYLALYEDREADESEQVESKFEPPLRESEPLNFASIDAKQHFTEPPSRFSEAGLVKKLEEMGIGRPSTYSSIISVLLDRQYVHMHGKCFMPNTAGVALTSFLKSFFVDYFDYDFTANLENKLDSIASGELEWKDMLQGFWKDFSNQVQGTQGKHLEEIWQTIASDIEKYVFRDEENKEHKVCPKCATNFLKLRSGKFGFFLACSGYPSCAFSQSIEGPSTALASEDKELGKDSKGNTVYLCKASYGPYLKLLSVEGGVLKKVTVPAKYASISVEEAIKVLELPKVICTNNGQEVLLSISKFGFYLKCGDLAASLGTKVNPFCITQGDALNALKERGKVYSKKPYKGPSKKKGSKEDTSK